MNPSKNNYLLSVIIPTFNRSLLLSYTLNSLVLQDLDKDSFEVIVSDDGSSDDTVNVVEKYKTLLNLKYVFQDDRGYRVASARNNGIRIAEGMIAVFIDSGVILQETCLTEHLDFHRRSTASKAAIGYVFGFDHDAVSEDELKSLIVPSNPGLSVERLSRIPLYHDVRDLHYVRYNYRIEDLPAPWYYFWTCHVSVTLADLERVGMFDEGYDGRWGGEDNDLGIKLLHHKVQLCLLREAIAIHYPHGKDKAGRKLEGYFSCLYLHNKFNTLETKLFIDNYYNDFVDINDLSLKIRATREASPGEKEEVLDTKRLDMLGGLI